MKKNLLIVLPMVMYWNVTIAQTGATLNFDGSDDYVSIGTQLTANSSYTKEAWIYPTDVSGARNIITSAKNPFWIFNNILSAGNNGDYSFVKDTVDLSINKWIHVAVTYDSNTGTMTLYKNGVMVSQKGSAPVYEAGTEIIGSQYGNSSFFVGNIDEVRIWNRALGIAEINKSMTCGVVTTGTGLVSNYHFNQGLAGLPNLVNTLTDASGNAKTGTLNNFSLMGATSNWVAPGVVSAVTTGIDVQTACVSYKWINGITYTANNNTAQDTLVNKAGCDSIVTLNLTIKSPTTGIDVQSACVSYKWIDGITYTASNNIAKDTLVNKVGCDSVVTLNLTIKNASTSIDIQSACSSYTWIDGVTYTESNNTAKDTLVNKVGCDSVVTLNLTIKKSLTTDVISACGPYKWINGITYLASNNTAKDTLVNKAGCDSIISLNLTIKNPTTGTDIQSACGSYKWIDGVTYTVNNYTAKDTIKNVAGCDSIVTLNLTIKNATTGTDTQSACGSYKWIDGVTYTANNNTAKDTLINVAGCDSVVTLNLTIKNPTTGTDVKTACGSYIWIDGVTYTASNNIAKDTLVNVVGCDSIVTLNLTINNPTAGTDVKTACGSYTWIDGMTYTVSNNTAKDTLVNAVGCDSIVTLNLTINNINITTTTVGDSTIVSNDTVAAYQWIDCGNNQTIAGAIARWYIPTVSGSYAVIVTSGVCSDTSGCVNIIVTGIKDHTFNNTVRIQPNPTSDLITINIDKNSKLVNYIITAIDGRTIATGTTATETFKVDLNNESKGLYFLRINQGNRNATFKIIKQ